MVERFHRLGRYFALVVVWMMHYKDRLAACLLKALQDVKAYRNVSANGSVPNLACIDTGRFPLTGSGMRGGAGYDGPPEDYTTRHEKKLPSSIERNANRGR